MRALMCALLLSLTAMQATGLAQSRQVFPGPAPNVPFSAAVRADGMIFVAGSISAEGDIRAQTRQTIENIGQLLQKAGSSLANVVAVHVYLTKADSFAAMNEAYRTFWPKDPPVRTTVVADLVVPGGLLEISMIAVPNGAERTVIHPSGWAASPNPYSYGIKTGDWLFLAGLVSRNGKDNSFVPGDMAVQTKTVLENAGEILKAAGMTYDNVVSSRVFVQDGTKFQDMNKVYQTFFPKDPPARATVIAPLTGPEYQLEITLTASRLPKQAYTTPAADGTPGKPNPVLSSAIKVGNRLYVSGILGNLPANNGDCEAQTVELLARVGRTLKAAGFDWSHVVDGVAYITDLSNFDAMNRGYRTVFAKDFPARATVRTGLLAPDGLVEIMFVATK